MPRPFSWTPEQLGLLGTKSDAKVARLIGISTQAVSAKRRELGISATRPIRAPIEWTPDRLALLGTQSDKKVAAIVGCSRETVKAKRTQLGRAPAPPLPHAPAPVATWTTEHGDLLGALKDREVAAQTGRTTKAVREERNRRGIAPSKNLPAAKVIEIRERYAAGERASAIADVYGVSGSTVCAIVNGTHHKSVGGPTTPVKTSSEAAQVRWGSKRLK